MCASVCVCVEDGEALICCKQPSDSFKNKLMCSKLHANLGKKVKNRH